MWNSSYCDSCNIGTIYSYLFRNFNCYLIQFTQSPWYFKRKIRSCFINYSRKYSIKVFLLLYCSSRLSKSGVTTNMTNLSASRKSTSKKQSFARSTMSDRSSIYEKFNKGRFRLNYFKCDLDKVAKGCLAAMIALRNEDPNISE